MTKTTTKTWIVLEVLTAFLYVHSWLFGALWNFENHNFFLGRFEVIKEEQHEKGVRFELIGIIETGGRFISVKLAWRDHRWADDPLNRKQMKHIVTPDLIVPEVGVNYKFRAIAKKPTFGSQEDD